MIIKKNIFKTGFLLIIYRMTLDLNYYYILNPLYAYSGFNIDISVISYILSALIFSIAILIVHHSLTSESISNQIIILLLLFSYIPFTTMVAMGCFSWFYIGYTTIFWIMIFVFHYIKFYDIKIKIKSFYSFKNVITLLCLTLSTMSVLYVSGKYRNFTFPLSFANVYDLRASAADLNLPVLLVYVRSFSVHLNILFIFYFLYIRRYFIVLLFIVLSLLNFGIDGAKTVIFLLVSSLFVYWGYKKFLHQLLIPMFIALSSLSLLEYFHLKSFIIFGIVIRRTFFLTNLLGYYYYDFFTQNQPDYFRQSFLRHFGISSPYANIQSDVIGAIYFNAPNMGANNGLVADAITNYGYLGLVLLPLFYNIIFNFLDNISLHIPPHMTFIIALLITMGLMNSFLQVQLLTHGLIIIAICLYIMDYYIYMATNNLNDNV